MSEEFKKLTLKYQIKIFADILNLSKPYDLLQHERFNYQLLMGFAGTLTKNRAWTLSDNRLNLKQIV